LRKEKRKKFCPGSQSREKKETIVLTLSWGGVTVCVDRKILSIKSQPLGKATMTQEIFLKATLAFTQRGTC